MTRVILTAILVSLVPIYGYAEGYADRAQEYRDRYELIQKIQSGDFTWVQQEDNRSENLSAIDWTNPNSWINKYIEELDQPNSNLPYVSNDRNSTVTNNIDLNANSVVSRYNEAMKSNQNFDSIIPFSIDSINKSNFQTIDEWIDDINEDGEKSLSLQETLSDPFISYQNPELFIDDNGEVKIVYGGDDKIGFVDLASLYSQGILSDADQSIPASVYLSKGEADEGESIDLSLGNITVGELMEAGRSTAILVKKDNISLSKDGNYYIPKLKLITRRTKSGEQKKICESDYFSKRKSLGLCTAFLAANDNDRNRSYLITAEHCTRLPEKDVVAIFGYTEELSIKIPKENVFELYEEGFYSDRRTDTAVVELAKLVPKTISEPLKLSGIDSVDVKNPVCFLGYPDGSSLVVGCGNSMVKSKHLRYFQTNTDTNKGNSGGPIIDANDLTAKGILIRGGADYILRKEKDCFTTNVVSITPNKFEKAAYLDWSIRRLKSLMR